MNGSRTKYAARFVLMGTLEKPIDSDAVQDLGMFWCCEFSVDLHNGVELESSNCSGGIHAF